MESMLNELIIGTILSIGSISPPAGYARDNGNDALSLDDSLSFWAPESAARSDRPAKITVNKTIDAGVA